MLNQYSDNDLLRRYLRGDIDARQEAELERRAAADPDVAAAVAGLRTLPEHDHAASVGRMMAKARSEAGAPVIQVGKQRRLPRYWWAAAAGLAVLIAVLFLVPVSFNPDGDTVTASELAPRDEPTEDAPETFLDRDIWVEEEPAALEEPRPAPSPPPISPAPAPAPTDKRGEPALVGEEVLVMETEVPRIQPEIAAPAPEVASEESMEVGEAPVAIGDARQRAEEQNNLAKTTRQTPENGQFSTARRAQARYFNGRVTDENGNPIPNALIRQPGLPLGETTDSNGVFRLNFDATTTLLNVSAAGFAAEQITVDPTGEDLQITLDALRTATAADLETGAVVRVDVEEILSGRSGKKNQGYAKPAPGFKELRKGMEAGRPAEVPRGKVRVDFSVNPDGSLGDFKFRGAPDGVTRTYVRRYLIEESVWENVGGEEPVRVYFRVNFR
ncbi:carboxypeptidase-like regulatory domain-containing protein [Neolewinella antarctica]|uniref:Uncharacterized protein n=1 Tax=Neolewinella antarctica TaxID=442734 RepID=A0ABX0XGB1_9BACT|nr:carboxypeptidase-like regulatory domain-containing protein [Neolewinella antarctica]NJC27949.1 hypothetical protein [Neolewinella antarctica]